MYLLLYTSVGNNFCNLTAWSFKIAFRFFFPFIFNPLKYLFQTSRGDPWFLYSILF